MWQGRARLERVRVQQILATRLPPAPATVLDVGGGEGVHSVFLAHRGYDVHLFDPVVKHVDEARAHGLDARIAEARALPFDDASADVVLLFGPLYHLRERGERLAALAETRRVLRPGGLLLAIAISRYAFLLDGLASERLFTKPGRMQLVADSIESGVVANNLGAKLHRPDELTEEIADAGFAVEELLGVEGPGWLLQDFDAAWRDDARRAQLLEVAGLVEAERDLVAASTHMLVIAR
ncbi:MAG TPA: methyltransferase domain-containing protein [Gaiellaceae bacterium]|nr:methyltransferase domain-containing protein [Gaiellaceae bacterium]